MIGSIECRGRPGRATTVKNGGDYLIETRTGGVNVTATRVPGSAPNLAPLNEISGNRRLIRRSRNHGVTISGRNGIPSGLGARITYFVSRGTGAPISGRNTVDGPRTWRSRGRRKRNGESTGTGTRRTISPWISSSILSPAVIGRTESRCGGGARQRRHSGTPAPVCKGVCNGSSSGAILVGRISRGKKLWAGRDTASSLLIKNTARMLGKATAW